MSRQIYILLTHTGTVFSNMIKYFTKEPYSHVSLALDRELIELYSFGRKKPRNPLMAGFIREDLVDGTYGIFPNTRCAIYSIEVEDELYNKLLRELEKFKKDKDKYRYNLLGLMGVILNKPIDRQYNYFCSEFVSELLNKSGINLIDKPAALTAPGDFRRCQELRLLYEGELRTYRDFGAEIGLKTA